MLCINYHFFISKIFLSCLMNFSVNDYWQRKLPPNCSPCCHVFLLPWSFCAWFTCNHGSEHQATCQHELCRWEQVEAVQLYHALVTGHWLAWCSTWVPYDSVSWLQCPETASFSQHSVLIAPRRHGKLFLLFKQTQPVGSAVINSSWLSPCWHPGTVLAVKLRQ